MAVGCWCDPGLRAGVARPYRVEGSLQGIGWILLAELCACSRMFEVLSLGFHCDMLVHVEQFVIPSNAAFFHGLLQPD